MKYRSIERASENTRFYPFPSCSLCFPLLQLRNSACAAIERHFVELHHSADCMTTKFRTSASIGSRSLESWPGNWKSVRRNGTIIQINSASWSFAANVTGHMHILSPYWAKKVQGFPNNELVVPSLDSSILGIWAEVNENLFSSNYVCKWSILYLTVYFIWAPLWISQADSIIWENFREILLWLELCFRFCQLFVISKYKFSISFFFPKSEHGFKCESYNLHDMIGEKCIKHFSRSE